MHRNSKSSSLLFLGFDQPRPPFSHFFEFTILDVEVAELDDVDTLESDVEE